jgi:hypothetical protein
MSTEVGHFSDMPGRAANVPYWDEIGLNADITSITYLAGFSRARRWP